MPVVFMAVFSTAASEAIINNCQRHVGVVKASLIYSLEPIVALAAQIVYDKRVLVSTWQIIGMASILVGAVLVILGSKGRADGEASSGQEGTRAVQTTMRTPAPSGGQQGLPSQTKPARRWNSSYCSASVLLEPWRYHRVLVQRQRPLLSSPTRCRVI